MIDLKSRMGDDFLLACLTVGVMVNESLDGAGRVSTLLSCATGDAMDALESVGTSMGLHSLLVISGSLMGDTPRWMHSTRSVAVQLFCVATGSVLIHLVSICCLRASQPVVTIATVSVDDVASVTNFRSVDVVCSCVLAACVNMPRDVQCGRFMMATLRRSMNVDVRLSFISGARGPQFLSADVTTTVLLDWSQENTMWLVLVQLSMSCTCSLVAWL